MFHPIDPKLIFSKNDLTDLRLGDFILETARSDYIPDTENNFSIQGYTDDEGVQLNGGRPGCAFGPDQIRHFLYKMTPPYNQKDKISIIDCGNIVSHLDLNEKHKLAFDLNLKNLNQNKKVISLGGGHDYGYADGAAFCNKFIGSTNEKPVIINIDAHLDVRPNDQSNHSGTPFYRLKREFKNEFELIEIGLQPQCNSRDHWNWAIDQGIQLFPLSEISNSNWANVWTNSIIQKLNKNTPVHISFDIDGLKNSEAGGCSQSWPIGLELADCLKFLNQIYRTSSCYSLGIYEVAPKFDFDHRTSKAASLIAYNFLFQGQNL